MVFQKANEIAVSECTGCSLSGVYWSWVHLKHRNHGVNEILKPVMFFCVFFSQLCLTFTAKGNCPLILAHQRCPGKGNKSQWIQYRDHCYTSDQALHSFSEARQFCSELGELECVDFSLLLNNLVIRIFLRKPFKVNSMFFENLWSTH